MGETISPASIEHLPPLSSAHTASPGVVVQLRRLRDSAQVPGYQTPGASGLDLCAAMEDGRPMTLAPLSRALVPTGLSAAIPRGYEGQVRPRSGWALKYGITVLNSPGTIDADYRGEIKVLLVNLGQEAVTIQPGDRIAQLVIAAVAQAVLCEVEVLDETTRGDGGFGHTGRGSSTGG